MSSSTTSANIQKNDLKTAYFQMHLAIFLWGFTGILGKAIHMHEGWIVWYRLLLTSISLFLIYYKSKDLLSIKFTDLKKLFGVGFVVTLHWMTFYAAIKASNVSITLACFASTALFTSFLEPLLGKKKPVWSEVFFGLLVIIGIGLIFSVQWDYAWGITLALISAFLGALFTVFNKSLVNSYTPEKVVFYELTGGFLFLTILLPFWPGLDLNNFLPGPVDGIYLLILSLACTTLAFTISLKALQVVSAFTMNLSVNLEPIYSIILAIIIFNEQDELAKGFYWGAIIILLSVTLHALLSYRKRKKNNKLKIIPFE